MRTKIGIDAESLRRAVEESGLTWELLTIEKLRALAERHGLVSQEFRDAAYIHAVHEALRKAIRKPKKKDQVPIFFNDKWEEEKGDGTTAVVQGYRHIDGLDEEAWNRILDNMDDETRQAMRKSNQCTEVYNERAEERGWLERPLPFPGCDDLVD